MLIIFCFQYILTNYIFKNPTALLKNKTTMYWPSARNKIVIYVREWKLFCK